MQESWEGYGKNWMHFVYKTDNLFRSMRVSDENSSVTKGFHYFELIWTTDFLCVQNAQFKATSSFFSTFWLHLLFFMHLLIILSYKTLKLKSISNELLKGWKLMTWIRIVHLNAKKVQSCNNLLKYWIAGVTDEFSSETLILRKRLSSLYTKCIQFFP